MKVTVEPPHIDGDTVTFRWSQSAPNPFQRTNAFSLRYADIDLSRFSPQLFYEIFLAYQVRIFALYREPIEMVFQEPVPRPTVAYWLGYHGVSEMTAGPLAEVERYSPWRPGGRPQRRRRSVGVFFGGGKDSTLAACLLSEVHGADEVLLVQFVHPFVAAAGERRRLEERQEALMLRPARESAGLATQMVWTDFLAQLTREGRAGRPHIYLYTVGALPVLLARGIRLAAFSREYTAHWTPHAGRGRTDFGHRQSRPEILADVSEHYRRVLGQEIHLTNANYFMSELVSFKVLAERYPDAFRRIVMCVGAEVDQRWCLQCKKCAEYALFGLALGIVDPDFDYDALLARSRYVRRVVDYATSGVVPSRFGNLPWQPFVSTRNHFSSFCHVVARCSLDLVPGHLSDEARGNVAILKAAFGNRDFPGLETMVWPAVERLNHDSIRRIAEIVSTHVLAVETLPGPWLVGNQEVEYDFHRVLPVRPLGRTPDRTSAQGRRSSRLLWLFIVSGLIGILIIAAHKLWTERFRQEK